MKNSKLKIMHAKFEISKSRSGLEILNAELEKVRGGRAPTLNNYGCGFTYNSSCS